MSCLAAQGASGTGVAELLLVALGAVDHDLMVDGQPRRPATLVLAGDAAALDALERVGVDDRALEDCPKRKRTV